MEDVQSSMPVTREPEQSPSTEEPKGDMLGETEAGFDDSSFFSTVASNRPRQFKEIVSSVQGTFDFLQESQIDIDSKCISMLYRTMFDLFVCLFVCFNAAMVSIPVDKGICKVKHISKKRDNWKWVGVWVLIALEIINIGALSSFWGRFLEFF